MGAQAMTAFATTTTPTQQNSPSIDAVEEEVDINTEFLPKLQSLAALLSLFTAVLLWTLGMLFMIFPQKALSLFLDDNSLNPYYSNDHVELFEFSQQKPEQHHELIDSTARLTGGLLLSQSLTSFLLLYPILLMEGSLCPSPTTRFSPMTVWNLRASIAVQAITGLVWILVGLLNDRAYSNDDIKSLDTTKARFGLLLVGFSILLISSFGLMLSYWPAVAERTTESERFEFLTTTATGVVPNEQEQTDEERLLDPLTEPLLTRTRQTNDEYQQRGSVNNESVVESEEIVEVDAAGAIETTTSRIRGTRRLLSLAAPQVIYLYIGCITLLIRLPFSLSIPHFVSTTLAALSRSEFDAARREVFWLSILGTVDAW
jgi:hypothetical protein